MPFVFSKVDLRSVVFIAVCISLFATAIILPRPVDSQNRSEVSRQSTSREEALPNYDIRSDKFALARLAEYRLALGRSAEMTANIRDGFVRAEVDLRKRMPSLVVEYNFDIQTPEVIGLDVKGRARNLTEASSIKRSDILKDFLQQNNRLIGAEQSQISELQVAADYVNPAGNLAFVELNQSINGIPVFRGEIKAGFTRDGEMFRVINNFAPGLEYGRLRTDFGDPSESVLRAAGHIDANIEKSDLRVNENGSRGNTLVFGSGVSATTAEKMYFPTEPGIAVPAWRVLIWKPVSAYYVIVDAEDGTLLWRKNITEDQTQAATYNVYVNPNAMVNVADSPFPMTPGTTSPNGMQANPINRTMITRIGNEAPYTFNNLGWITDGNNTTDGNNVQAGLDRELPNSGGLSPSDIDPTGMATGAPNRVFDFPISPGIPTNPALNTGDAPLPAGQTPTGCLEIGTSAEPTDFQKAAVTQMFYVTNVFHAEMYLLGFTEAARNFQHDNFGRGGEEGDRISAQAQDCSGTNNANFSTPADGSRGQMQMYLWTGPNPDFDGALDADIVIHELAHGVSNRLHGNSTGLFNDMSRAMGEGWSDFYAHCMLSEPTDPINATYPIGAYTTYRFGAVGFNNYFYGIRRFPKAVMAYTGGTQNRPFNPLTFADMDATQQNLTDGAFSPRFTGVADQVHNAGEIWSSTLWEVRAKLIARLGWSEGNRRILQYVTDGMKVSPLSPTMVSGRDAIIAATAAGGSEEDVSDMWEGFALRGLGAGASIQNVGGTSTGGTSSARVTENYGLPNLTQAPVISISDATGDNDGYPEPGETVVITIPLTNQTGLAATNVSLQIVGGDSSFYGTMSGISTETRQLTYTIPENAPCGGVFDIAFEVNSSLGPVTFNREFFVGRPSTTATTENFDGVTAPEIPAGWTAEAIQGGINFVTSTGFPDTQPNSVFALNPTTIGGGTNLTSPPIVVESDQASISFRNLYNVEENWDGGVLEISLNGGPFQDIVAAGGSFLQNGYNGTLGPGTNNPLAHRAAWTGNSMGYVTTVAQLPASANGTLARLQWRFGADNNTAVSGWHLDTFALTGAGFVTEYDCDVAGTKKARADFDGDGRTDVSIYRPSDGSWWIDRSMSGLAVYNWGIDGDIPVPADYDGDGKTDLAVFRPDPGVGNATFYILNSETNTITYAYWGLPGDVPVIGDYDGDGRDDISLWRESDTGWYTLKSTGGHTAVPFGASGDKPMAIEFDDNGQAEMAVYRPSDGTWYIENSVPGGDPHAIRWGLAGDKPVPADYDGDGRDDLAVYRPSDGVWYILRSSDGQAEYKWWGIASDVPVPGDYDGDGRADVAVFRDGIWYINRTTSGIQIFQFGVSSDVPIPKAYIP